MRPIGFSTGALACSDFRSGLRLLRNGVTDIVELSALRQAELEPLINAIETLELSSFRYVSVHAPSKYEPKDELSIIRLLSKAVEREWSIILHPDAISDFSAWGTFGSFVLIENMDKRNLSGRTAEELFQIFEKLPKAGLCFDLGHCRQVDPTMNESLLILKKFGNKLGQLHVSDVNSKSTHDPLSCASISAFQKVSHLIPEDVPVILETPVNEHEIKAEIELARLALPLTPNGAQGSRAKHLQSMIA